MSADVSESDIPTPETVIKKSLGHAPGWLRRSALNALGVVAWVGLPSTVLSTLKDLRWVIDGALWLYQHAGLLKPALLVIARAVSLAVDVWRWITHPIWQSVAEWLHITLPAWLPDVLTLLVLILVGLWRRWLNASWGAWLGGGLLLRSAKRSPTDKGDFTPIPRRFPYTRYFADTGEKWTPRRLADAQCLWRRWRSEQIRAWLARHPERWPRFHEAAIRAQFGRYWLAVQDGRRERNLYVGVAVLLILLLVADAACATGLLS
ncbi:MAG: hypothetical protein AB7G40_05635 [Hyphomonadaceae bacterium]